MRGEHASASIIRRFATAELIAHMSNDVESRLSEIEAKLQELEALAHLALRLLAVDQPVGTLLRQFGATEAQERAVHALLDDVAARSERGGIYLPSFAGFTSDLYARFPAVRNNREFVVLLIDALKLDRPTYQKLHAYAQEQQWPQWK
jgi:hypothetical protein